MGFLNGSVFFSHFSGVLGYIPSPSSGNLELGPLNIRYYGLFIALGILAAIWLIRARLKKNNMSPDIIINLAWVGVPAGLIGARIYHVITDWSKYSDNLGDIPKIWEGGLGIPGGVALGAVAMFFYSRAKGWKFGQIVEILLPGLPLAHAIGRLGNYFNQELFGSPTSLPWGLEIERKNRPLEYINEAYFHPVFLYEGLLNLCLMGFLIWIDSKKVLQRGYLLAVYVISYASIRLWLEFVRVDEATELLGVRVNVWVMAGLWLIAAGFLARSILKAGRLKYASPNSKSPNSKSPNSKGPNGKSPSSKASPVPEASKTEGTTDD